MNEKQEKQIQELLRLRMVAYGSILAGFARDIAEIAAKDALRDISNTRTFRNSAETKAAEIANKVLQGYLENINKGGTMCVEKVETRLPNGNISFTTKEVFKPWLDDMRERDTKAVIDLIGQAETAGVYPLDIAKQLQEYFQGTNHNAVTAARTEAQKIRSDARFTTFADQGIKYGEYVTVGDDRVRPEHAARDGKIYRLEDFPYLGEYDCRCTCVPADYQVEMKGAHVEPSGEIILTEEQLRRDTTSPLQLPESVGKIGDKVTGTTPENDALVDAFKEENPNVSIRVGKIDVEQTTNILSTASQILAAYPVQTAALRSIRVTKLGNDCYGKMHQMSKSGLMHVELSQEIIDLGTLGQKSLMNKLSLSGKFPNIESVPPTSYATSHEIGHVIGKYLQKEHTEYFGKLQSALNNPRTKKEIASILGANATKTINEFCADAFAVIWHNIYPQRDRHELIDEFGKILMKAKQEKVI